MKKIILILLIIVLKSSAQRSYTNSSALSTGTWAKIGVTTSGLYKIDIALLNTLGFNTTAIASNNIRLFGNGGGMLNENNTAPYTDDLLENAIWIEDGGDGVFNNNDYALFYSKGPHHWNYDTAFYFRNNLYSDTAFYFISIGGIGKRITNTSIPGNPNYLSTGSTERLVFAPTTTNLLSSGKQWVGDPFTNTVGGVAQRNYTINIPNTVSTEPVIVTTNLVARTIGAPANFTVSINGQAMQTLTARGVTGDLFDDYATTVSGNTQRLVSATNVTIGIQFNATATGANGWLQELKVLARRSLSFTGNSFLFRDPLAVGANRFTHFTITNSPASTKVWNITDATAPIQIDLQTTSNNIRFNDSSTQLKEYIAFVPAAATSPLALGSIRNQNLHEGFTANGIIVTHPSFLSAANSLAAFHKKQYNLIDKIVTTQDIYNEFASGMPDPTAIRNYLRMCVERGNLSASPYLILFGTASFDPKNRIVNNTNLVPTWQSTASFTELLSHNTDDFFGILQPANNINSGNPSVDIAIGRLPVATLAEANTMVDKIIRYHSKETLGNWRSNLVLVADDQDNNLHLNNAEALANTVQTTNAFIAQQKIYIDAYPAVSSAGGTSFPAVNEALVNTINKGALVVNYSGHGNDQRLAQEAIFSLAEKNRLQNDNKLPLLITASCDFAPFDQPAKKSLGEALLHDDNKGAVALLTTTRLVFASSNQVMNNNFLRVVLKPSAQQQYLSLGEALRLAKNSTISETGDALNSRKFVLLGDPAMKLAIPKFMVAIDSINGKQFTTNDSLQATGRYTLRGKIVDGAGNKRSNFNGTLSAVIFDKPQQIQTRGNSAGSIPTSVRVQENRLFNGQSTVTDGSFTLSFVVPKDISFAPGKGSIYLYAAGIDSSDAWLQMPIGINGIAATIDNDNQGPTIDIKLNDALFRTGGLTNENPLLLVHLSDTSGINATGNSIGHDIVATINNDQRNSIVLNRFFTSAIDRYTQGTVRYQLPTLPAGRYSLRVKAWDVLNNSNEAGIEFIVAPQTKLLVTKVMNFPNPFTERTRFSFEHNQPNTNLEVDITILNSMGQTVKKINKTLYSSGTRLASITWNGDTDNGRKLGRGIYFYRIIVQAGEQKTQFAAQILLQ